MYRAVRVVRTADPVCPRATVLVVTGRRHSHTVYPVAIQLIQQKVPDPCYSASRSRQAAQHGEYRHRAAGEFFPTLTITGFVY